MEIPEITCARVDDAHLDTRYLNGELPEDLAEAFEAHFFACERCWSLVHGGLAAAAAIPDAAPASRGADLTSRPALRRRRLVPWATAAGIAAILLVYAGGVGRQRNAAVRDVVRGGHGGFSAAVSRSADSATVQWSAQPGAAHYRITVFSAAGNAQVRTTTSRTRWGIALDSVRRLAGAGRLWLQVDALDSLDQLIATTPLTALSDSGNVR
jgi:Putative zinc-finger